MTERNDTVYEGVTRAMPQDSRILQTSRSLLGINSGAALLSIGYVALISRYYTWQGDFTVYYHAAEAMRAGVSPYHLPGSPYFYGPIFITLLRPFVAIDLFHARILWFVLQCVALSLFVWISVRESDSLLARRWWGILLLCVATARPTLYDLTLGQIGIFTALVIVVSFAVSQRHRAVAGFLLALAISVKFSPALLSLAFLRERRWSMIGWTIAGSLSLFALTVLLYGLDIHTDLVRSLLWQGDYPVLAEHNDSLYAFWLRIFSTNHFVRPIADHPSLALGLIGASTVVLLATCLSLTGPHGKHKTRVLQFNLWLCAMVLIGPVSGLYSLVLLLPAALSILEELERRPQALLVCTFGIALGLLYAPPMSSIVGTGVPESRWQSLTLAPPLFSVLLMLALSIVIRRRG